MVLISPVGYQERWLTWSLARHLSQVKKINKGATFVPYLDPSSVFDGTGLLARNEQLGARFQRLGRSAANPDVPYGTDTQSARANHVRTVLRRRAGHLLLTSSRNPRL